MTTPPWQSIPVRGGRRIVHRTRLLRDLAEVSTQTVLLVAPAGYGKTTFVEQWLNRFGGVRWAATPASSDLSALTRDLAAAIARVAAIPPGRIGAALHPGVSPQDRVELFERTVLDEIDTPVDSWLVVDDYQLLMSNRYAETLVGLIERNVHLRLMIASRERPSWATSRRFVHLELVEVGPPDLAFDDDEVRELLRPTLRNERLREQARGWPAVIALAAQVESDNITITEDTLAETLYDYFAEELFERAAFDVKELLIAIALLPRMKSEVLSEVPDADGLLRRVYETGLVQDIDHKLDVHPLARSFLLAKARDRQDVSDLVDSSISVAIKAEMWDEAFELLKEFAHHERLEELLTTSLTSLIETGRIATVQKFARHGAMSDSVSAKVLDLVAAEVGLRDGDYGRASALASASASCFDLSDPLLARSLIIAGEAARLNHRLDEALQLYTQANRVARRPYDLHTASWGRCLVALALESDFVDDLVRDFESLGDKRPEDRLRLLTAESW